MKDQTKLIAALLVGVAAGAALGILLAPDSGEGTRGDIGDYFTDLIGSAKSKARSTADNLKDYGNNAMDKARSKFSNGVEEMQERGSNGVNEAKSRVKVAANDVNDSIQQA